MASTQDQPFKVDYYSQHLFAQLTSYQLRKDADDAAEAAAKLLKANSSKAFYMTGRAKDHQHSHNIVPTIRTLDVDIQGKPNARPRSLRTQSSTISELGRSTLAVVHSTTSVPTSRSMDEDAVKLLKLHSGALDVVSTRVFVFLLRDGESKVSLWLGLRPDWVVSRDAVIDTPGSHALWYGVEGAAEF